MNINTISTVHSSLQQIREVTSSWDDDRLGDADVYAACDELDLFGPNTPGESDAIETPAEKSARVVRDRADDILARVGHSSISPSELLSNLDSDIYGTRRKVEDDGFIKLYRGYSSSADYDWNAGVLENAH
ncbi:hypothetical protein PILCRDRAFT_829841 [Piloderma croceum F 1598]|uniref:Uncharacterized protein n=1 Tax=Piloderma croceum (strain F 1598) TaxID=765440 RepID=A0A0C3EX03_PILCF|nr:hypothetical protein PILCRDRAFT_829841 [Piloderma croceum F 1598]